MKQQAGQDKISNKNQDPQGRPGSEPVFLMPAAVTIFALLLLAVHTAFEIVLDADHQWLLAVWFGYLPVRWVEMGVPGGMWPLIWTPITHAFLHGSWPHVFLNVAWLVIFGTPVARRYGAMGMLAGFLVGAVAGVMVFTLLQWGDVHVLVGASGGVAGLTGLAIRFLFQPINVVRHPETGAVVAAGRALLPLGRLLTNPRARVFTLFWVGFNLAIPVYDYFTGTQGSQIAWQAHLGGFAGGLLIAPLCERWATRRKQKTRDRRA